MPSSGVKVSMMMPSVVAVRIAVRRPEMFDRVVQALHMLDLERDTEHTPPTK